MKLLPVNRDEKHSIRVPRRCRKAAAMIGVIAVAVIVVAQASFSQEGTNDSGLLKDAQVRFEPLPKDLATAEAPITPERVELGRKLFFDPRMSVDGTVSCAKCHQPALYGTDGMAKARGAVGVSVGVARPDAEACTAHPWYRQCVKRPPLF